MSREKEGVALVAHGLELEHATAGRSKPFVPTSLPRFLPELWVSFETNRRQDQASLQRRESFSRLLSVFSRESAFVFENGDLSDSIVAIHEICFPLDFLYTLGDKLRPFFKGLPGDPRPPP